MSCAKIILPCPLCALTMPSAGGVEALLYQVGERGRGGWRCAVCLAVFDGRALWRVCSRSRCNRPTDLVVEEGSRWVSLCAEHCPAGARAVAVRQAPAGPASSRKERWHSRRGVIPAFIRKRAL